MVVYTANLACYDVLRPPLVIAPDVDYVCFADGPMPAVPPWRIVPAYQPPGLDTARVVRLHKCLPHLVLEDPPPEVSLWQDANMQLAVHPGVLVNRHLTEAPLALFAHPERIDLYAEAEVCIARGLDGAAVIRAQMARYRPVLPAAPALWAGGVILRRHTAATAAFNETWWHEVLTGSHRDQLALPYALFASGPPVAVLPGDLFANPLVRVHRQHRPGPGAAAELARRRVIRLIAQREAPTWR